MYPCNIIKQLFNISEAIYNFMHVNSFLNVWVSIIISPQMSEDASGKSSDHECFIEDSGFDSRRNKINFASIDKAWSKLDCLLDTAQDSTYFTYTTNNKKHLPKLHSEKNMRSQF